MQSIARVGTTLATSTPVTLTAAQVTAIVRDSSTLHIAAGCELLDVGLNVLADITDDFEGGSVSRDAYANLHGTGTLYVARELDWGTAILRPYMLVSNDVTQFRANLGAYLTSSPTTDLSRHPVTHEVTAFDILHWLNTPVGEAYVVDAGVDYLAAAEAILLNQGITAYSIDQSRAGTVLPVARAWPFDATTWLEIVNDLLATIGYQGLWSDWDGRLRMNPYDPPSLRATEWLYDTGQTTSMLGLQRTMTRDWFQTPNRWVFYWSQDPNNSQPVEGNGIFTYQNDSTGPTSVQARGRVITAQPVQVNVADQQALVAYALTAIDADLRLRIVFGVPVAPNPLHWHFDVVTVNDPDAGPLMDVLVTKWTLPLDGSDMTQEWSLL